MTRRNQFSFRLSKDDRKTLEALAEAQGLDLTKAILKACSEAADPLSVRIAFPEGLLGKVKARAEESFRSVESQVLYDLEHAA